MIPWQSQFGCVHKPGEAHAYSRICRRDRLYVCSMTESRGSDDLSERKSWRLLVEVRIVSILLRSHVVTVHMLNDTALTTSAFYTANLEMQNSFDIILQESSARRNYTAHPPWKLFQCVHIARSIPSSPPTQFTNMLLS
jgi:hypothetical protein